MEEIEQIHISSFCQRFDAVVQKQGYVPSQYFSNRAVIYALVDFFQK